MTNKKPRGPRAKTRHTLKNRRRVTMNKRFEQFAVGARVAIKINSSVHSGMPNRRFHGKSGQIKAKSGKCFIVSVNQGNMEKSIIVNPAHLYALGTPDAVGQAG